MSLFGKLLSNSQVNVYESGYSHSIHCFIVCLVTPGCFTECGFVLDVPLKLVVCVSLKFSQSIHMRLLTF